MSNICWLQLLKCRLWSIYGLIERVTGAALVHAMQQTWFCVHLCEHMFENQPVMSYVWVNRRTWLCLELHRRCKRPVFDLLVVWTVQHRGPSVARRTRGVPGARGANKYAVKSVLREVWKESEGETLGFVWNRSPRPLTSAVHMLPLSFFNTHTHILTVFPFTHTPRTEVHSSNKQRLKQRAGPGVNSSGPGWFSFSQGTATSHCFLMGHALNGGTWGSRSKWGVK